MRQHRFWPADADFVGADFDLVEHKPQVGAAEGGVGGVAQACAQRLREALGLAGRNLAQRLIQLPPFVRDQPVECVQFVLAGGEALLHRSGGREAALFHHVDQIADLA